MIKQWLSSQLQKNSCSVGSGWTAHSQTLALRTTQPKASADPLCASSDLDRDGGWDFCLGLWKGLHEAKALDSWS